MPPITKPDRNNVTPSLQHALVGDAMRQGVFSCPVDASPANVAQMMAAHHVHCIFVTHPAFEEGATPYVWGIISDLDLMRAVLGGDDAETAGALAHQPIVTVKPTMRLTDAGALMVRHHVTHLVVVDAVAHRPIGVLSTTDITDVYAWAARAPNQN